MTKRNLDIQQKDFSLEKSQLAENIKSDLGEKLLKQDFCKTEIRENAQLQKCQKMAQNFVDLENGIAILSDLQNDTSYIYSGKLAQEIGVFKNIEQQEIDSIWEEELFAKLNPSDILQKHMLELQFFQFIKSIPTEKRKDYCVMSRLRMDDHRLTLLHKMFYFTNSDDQNVELALCLYNFDYLNTNSAQGIIISTADGSVIPQTEDSNNTFLTDREKQILRMIQEGRLSKEIAETLFISVNTVNRHRQNILEKMRVGNTAEACALAIKMNWI